jgi:iron complex transport system substrate-binding protein
MNNTHRTARTLLALAVAAVTLAACGSSDEPEPTESETDGSGTGEPSAAGPFPVQVEGTWGTVELSDRPERVVALTPQIGELLMELGVQPVAVAVDEDDLATTWPWLEGQFTGTLDPTLTTGDRIASPEQIMTYDPDLVVGQGFQVPEETYDQLSEVTTVYPGVRSGIPAWDETAAALADLTGTDLQPLLDHVEEACAQAQEQLPELAGGTYEYGIAMEGSFWFGNGTALECLGLEPAANQDNDQTSDNAVVAMENLSRLDADVLVVWDTDGTIEQMQDNPIFGELPASTTGAVVEPDDALGTVINLPGPIGFEYLIETIVPELQSAQVAS